MKLDKLIFLALVSCQLFSCEQIAYKEPANLTVDQVSIEVEADAAVSADPFSQEEPILYDTLGVTYNRSWTVSVETEDGGNWLSPLVSERINMSGQTQSVPLILRFDRNRSNAERRALLTFRSAELSEVTTVDVVQKAYSPSLTLTDNGVTVVPAIDGNCYAIVRSNTEWTAAVDANKSTVIPELDKTSGMDTQAILLTFPDNPDDGSARAAILNVRGKGCEVQTLKIIQHQGEYCWYIDGEVGGELSPMAENVHIPLRSNGAWSAEISNCTFQNARLEPSEGKGTLTGFTFYADHGFDPTVVEKHATITIRREGEEDMVVSFSQRGCIHLNFGHYNPKHTNEKAPYTKLINPFSSPSKFPTSYSTKTYAGLITDCVMKNGGFVFTMFGADYGIWYNSTGQLWMIGRCRHDYILFPAVEGHRLSQMYFEASCRLEVPYTVRTENGSTIIKGGEYVKTAAIRPVTQEYMDLHIHTFPETEEGKRYRLNLEEDTFTLSVKDLCLIYESVE